MALGLGVRVRLGLGPTRTRTLTTAIGRPRRGRLARAQGALLRAAAVRRRVRRAAHADPRPARDPLQPAACAEVRVRLRLRVRALGLTLTLTLTPTLTHKTTLTSWRHRALRRARWRSTRCTATGVARRAGSAAASAAAAGRRTQRTRKRSCTRGLSPRCGGGCTRRTSAPTPTSAPTRAAAPTPTPARTPTQAQPQPQAQAQPSSHLPRQP